MKNWKISIIDGITIISREIDDSDNENLICVNCGNKPKFINVVIGNDPMVVSHCEIDMCCWCGECKL